MSTSLRLSPAQGRIVRAMIELSAEMDGWPLTVRDIVAKAGLASTSTVHGHLFQLQKMGVVEARPGGRVGFRLSPKVVVPSG